jgi:hypothetical protein
MGQLRNKGQESQYSLCLTNKKSGMASFYSGKDQDFEVTELTRGVY